MKGRKAGWKQILRDERGLTLLEVMTAGFLLTMVLSVFLAGISHANRVQLRILSLKQAGASVEEDFVDKNRFVSGSVSLQFEDGRVIEKDGWMYDSTDLDGNPADVTYILTEEGDSLSPKEEDAMP